MAAPPFLKGAAIGVRCIQRTLARGRAVGFASALMLMLFGAGTLAHFL